MNEILQFIEDLKKIRDANFKATLIENTIAKYESMVDDFEKENKQEDPMGVTGFSNAYTKGEGI